MAKKKEEVATSKKWPRIYIGASSARSYLKPRMVFSEGYPVPVREILQRHPWVEQLIVPTDQYSKSISDIKKKGSLLNTLYLRMLKELRDGKL